MPALPAKVEKGIGRGLILFFATAGKKIQPALINAALYSSKSQNRMENVVVREGLGQFVFHAGSVDTKTLQRFIGSPD